MRTQSTRMTCAADKISQGKGQYGAFAGYAKATMSDRLTIGSSLATDRLKHVRAPLLFKTTPCF